MGTQVTYGAGGWGLHVERLHEDPWSPRILHKIEREGCCHPSNLQAQMCGCCAPCKSGKKRSYLWIMEAGVEANAACCWLVNPFNCSICSTDDFVTKVYYDNGPFNPCCCGYINKGIATENDLNYCCFCINCVCWYNMCTKPCCGGVVATVCVPNESECAYKIATRCCAPLCTSPVLNFVKDSESAKTHLLAAMRASMERKKAMQGVKSGQSSPRITRGSSQPSTGGMAPQPQAMDQRELSNPHL